MKGKIERMVDVIKRNDVALRGDNELYKRYFSPDIPEKICKKLIKHFDSHLSVNNLVAFYDSSLLGNCKNGLLFTSSGFYDHFVISKPVYINYADIKEIKLNKSGLEIILNLESIENYCVIETFDMKVLENMLKELIKIDSEYNYSSKKSSGKVKKVDLPPDMMKKCKDIIHGCSIGCGGIGTGLAQIPASDNALIAPIQIGMIISLGKVFDLNITESAAKGIIKSIGATYTGRTITQYLIGWFPGIGNAINTATAAGITEAVGWLAVKNFYDRWIEDHNKGRYEGKKEGYAEASDEFEQKLRKQADDFLKQKKNVERALDEYEQLLDEYEKYILELEEKCAPSKDIDEFASILNDLRELKTK